ncbi:MULTISPECIES: precorrin-3B synthase [unclassified Caballeronia]|uniref:precorrin-3B synthase n=1 Tax=unclassified Caballeronia TaxID=2646786 RepID=UPI00285D7905|nr:MULTISPECIES: precorrin-3B synthase [unclassified Caballeronia]MDR5739374.1 precorrin-3B synthase [Caballeronia sp. LZ016]MDR5807862.1 precorrin-3B synthase [Caballeronia sp. LZ019]
MRIVPARDGGLARLRLTGGELGAPAAHAVARAAMRCGSGVIDVTNRANLQLRGIRDDAHAELVEIAMNAGLGPQAAGGDDIRNVMLSPLANASLRSLAAGITAAMQSDAALHALSPKFSLQLDGGERLAMLDHAHDVWLSALDGGARFAFGFAGSMPHRVDHAPALGSVARDAVVPFVVAVLHAFLAQATPEEHRMREFLARVGVARFLHALTFDAVSTTWRRAPSDASLRLGAHAMPDDNACYVGAQPPLGRLDAATLGALADLATSHGEGRLIVTPWQSIIVPGVVLQDTQSVIDRLDALGLVTDSRHPLARLIACTGSSGCAKSHADTKADAYRLAPLLPPDTHVHLSGCDRSCAAAHPVAVTLFAVEADRYDVHWHPRRVARNLSIEEAAAWLARSHADA